MGDNNSIFSFTSTNWQRVKVLGGGTYGMVFLANPIPGSFGPVATKVALMDHASSLIREEHILKNFVGCPEIIQCLGSDLTIEPGSNSNYIFYNLILEYAPGGTLTDLIECRGPLPENEVKEYLRMILRGLYAIHSKGFAHADLKPDNILIFPKRDGKLQLKIADFGLSGRCEKPMMSALWNMIPKFRGTPRYMSSDSVFFGIIDAELDVWSLGCILIEMVSGKQVWSECINEEQIMLKLVLLDLHPDIPKELSIEGRSFLNACFVEKWTVEKLLQHPYLKEEHKVENCFRSFELGYFS